MASPASVTSIDDAVFQLAVELTNQTNRPLRISELFAMVTTRLGVAPVRANESIYNLLKMRKLVEGSKLTYQDIMANPLRSRISEYITKNPGSHVRDIRRAMNIDNAESAWHLKMLEKKDFKVILSGMDQDEYDENELYVRGIDPEIVSGAESFDAETYAAKRQDEADEDGEEPDEGEEVDEEAVEDEEDLEDDDEKGSDKEEG